MPPVPLGDVMRAYAVGTVDASNHPDYKPGDAVSGLFGVQTVRGLERQRRHARRHRLWHRWSAGSADLGCPGGPPISVCSKSASPRLGETVVVSAASGAVGSIVGQIAKIKGCRAVGIAGGPEKCRVLTEKLGFDAAVDYKSPTFFKDLKAACPSGIDVYFENVGGEVLDTVLPQMNKFGRIPVCGLISAYNATELPPGPKNLRFVLTQRLRMQGFIVFDFANRVLDAISELSEWYASGQLKVREDVREGGIDAFPDVLNLLYTGGNNGKLVLKV